MELLDELTMLADEDKKEIVESILDELGIQHGRRISKSGEMVIPCTVVDYHSDQNKNPTAAINFKKMLFNCLGCQSSGTILWYVAETMGLDGSQQALAWIKERVGINQVMDAGDLLRYVEQMYDREAPLPIPQYSQKMLLKWLMPNHAYFAGRGISLEQALNFRLGYDADADRIIIPHFFDSKLAGWMTRRLGRGGEKYKNSTDFPRDATVFNYRPRMPTVVVESALSAIRHDGEDIHVEATMGGKVTDEQVGLLAKHPRVILFMDNDRAGWSATESMYERLGPLTNVWIVNSPWEEDPGDLPSEAFQLQVTSAIPGALWARPTGKLLRYDHS